MAILQIRVRSGVLILGRPGQLHDLMDYASDNSALSAAIYGVASDRVALGALRRGWASLAPNSNLATAQHVDLVHEVARLVRGRQIDAALIANQGLYFAEDIDEPSESAAHFTSAAGTLVIARRSELTAGELAECTPELVTGFLKSCQPSAEELVALRQAWPNLMPAGTGPAGNSVAMFQQVANAVGAKQVGAVMYAGGVGKQQAAARSDAPKPIRNWSTSDKLRAALLRSLDYLGAALRSQIAEFFTPANIGATIAILAIFAALQAVPVVGEIVDAGLLLTLWYYGGKQALNGVIELAKGSIGAASADNAHEIDEAARTLAKGFEHLGKGGLSLVFAWFATRSMLGRAGTAEETAGASSQRQRPKEEPPAPTVKPLPAEVQRMPKAFQDEYRAAEAAGWKKPDGSTWYPPNNGGVGDPIRTTLDKNKVLDRFGKETGAYTSAAGDSFASRALPGTPGVPNKYVVTARGAEKMLVEKAEIAPWFGQPGGGTQYRLINADGSSMSVADAIQRGFLTRGP